MEDRAADAKPDLIELLGPSLLDSERETVNAVASLARSIRISLGWHYLLDVAWTNREIAVQPGMTVLDAGAGIGIMQWLLAGRGVNVLSVDRLDRSRLPLRFRTRYRVDGLRPDDLSSMAGSLAADARSGAIVVDASRHARTVMDRVRGRGLQPGTITLHHASLENLAAIPDSSVDRVVSLSSLEHNDPDQVPGVVAELWRTLKPGGVLTATVGAAKTEDWFHKPSRGWCFTEATLRRLFGLGQGARSNYDQFDEIITEVRANAELRDNLARSYYRSGNNGMPWGRWDPTYLSVGVRRQKRA